MLEYAVEAGALNTNPSRQLKRKPRQAKLEARVLTSGEQARLLAYWGPWLRPVILASLLAALRLGEVAGLRWRDVDFENGKLHVRRTLNVNDKSPGPPKGGRPATIDLHPELAAILRELRTPRNGPDDPVFPNGIGAHRQPRDIQRAFNNVRRYAGLSDEPRQLRFHDLRHTAISRLANAPGAQLPWVQEYARHADIATTFGYVHKIADEERITQAWAALAG